MDVPQGIVSLAAIPKDYQRKPLGSRTAIMAVITQLFPDAQTTDLSWARLERLPAFSLEISLGECEPVEQFTFHTRGGSEARLAISKILDALGLRALDPESPTGLFESSRN
jgi:hypothetical protein